MLLDCPSCAASYDEDPARLLPGGHPVRCPRCHATWHPEILFDTNTGRDDAPRIAILSTGVRTAGLSVHANRKQGARLASLDAIELIRKQAHQALNSIRSRYREDHNRIVSLQAARAAIPPPHASDSLAEAATPSAQPGLPNTGQDTNTRMRLSRAFAEALADVPGDVAGAAQCTDGLPEHELPQAGNEIEAFALAVEVEQPADGGSGAAAIDEAEQPEWIASAADKQDAGPIAALAANPANERGGQREDRPAPAEDRSTALWQTGDRGLQAAPASPWEDQARTVSLTERKRPPTKQQERGITGLRPRQKREHGALLDSFVESRQREELIREARKAAQRAIRESAPEPRAAGGGWRNMWVALIITSAILLFLRLWFQ